jgi:hypothetical protein
MQFDPKFSFWFGIAVTALIGIGSGSVSLTNALPPDWIPYVVAWTKILSFFGSAILTAMHGFSSGSSGPFVSPAPAVPKSVVDKSVIAILTVGLSALALAGAGSAHAENSYPNFAIVDVDVLEYVVFPAIAVTAAICTVVGIVAFRLLWRWLSVVVAAAMISALALAWASPADAQQRQPFKPTGDLVKDIKTANGQPALAETNPLDELAAKIRKLSLDDFKYASALAHATGNAVTAPCWDMWVKLLTAQQQPLNGADGQPLKEPDPHLATDIERLSEMVAQLQPRSELSVACAPMATTAQKDAATLIGAVLSGGALGLFKLPFAIP